MTAINGYNIKTVLSFFFKAGVRAKRSKLFFLISLVPAIIILIVKLVILLNPGTRSAISNYFSEIGGSFYFQLFLPILALFYGSTVLNDEIDNKTLIYLTTTPVSRGSILVGKFLAHFSITAIIVSVGLLFTFVVSHTSQILETVYIKQFVIFTGVALLALMAYGALFTMLGTLLKRAILLGLFFIFGWESVVQFIPGTTQKLTISHYVKSLLPVNLANTENPLAFQLMPSSTLESIVTLLTLTLIFLILSSLLFYKKEFLLSEHA
ncbi:MAG: ABC transporter permease subunit [bacterium]|nr:ABC transporter permease subunit [bacterium]